MGVLFGDGTANALVTLGVIFTLTRWDQLCFHACFESASVIRFVHIPNFVMPSWLLQWHSQVCWIERDQEHLISMLLALPSTSCCGALAAIRQSGKPGHSFTVVVMLWMQMPLFAKGCLSRNVLKIETDWAWFSGWRSPVCKYTPMLTITDCKHNCVLQIVLGVTPARRIDRFPSPVSRGGTKLWP